MANIQYSYDPTVDAILFDVQGAVTPSDITNAFNDQFATRPSDRVIWNVLNADLSNIGVTDMRRIVDGTQQFNSLRKKPRTVFIARGHIETILLKLYKEVAEEGRPNISYHIVGTREEALAWLGEPDGN